MNLEEKVLERIKSKNVHMHSRWFFYMQDTLKCIAGFLFLLLAALFSGVSIALGVHWVSEISTVNFPYTLIVLSVTMVFLAYEAFSQSFSFYKIRFSIGIGVLFLIAAVAGYVIFSDGQAENIEIKMQSFSWYQKIVPEALWEDEAYEVREMLR